MFDPQLYLDIAEGRNGDRLSFGDDGVIENAKIISDEKQKTATKTLYAGHPYANQTWYDSSHADAMVAYLKGAVRPVGGSESATLRDTVDVGSGKEIVAVRLLASTTERAAASDGWTELMRWDAASPDRYDCSGESDWLSSVGGSGGVDLAGTRVLPAEGSFAWLLTNVTADVWVKAEVRVVSRPVSSIESASFTVTPYVQHPTADGMSVLYFTSSPLRSAVRCWPEGDETAIRMAWAAGVEATNLVSTGHSSDVPVWGTQYRHRVRFEGLRAGTTYRYEVELEDGVGYSNAFRTAPNRDTPVKFVAYSDSETTPNGQPDADGWDVLVNGSDTKKTYAVARSAGYAANIRHMEAWQPDLIVIAGDLVARGGVQMFWDEFWRHNAGANVKGFNDPAGSVPILATVGNHDLYDNKNRDAYDYELNEHGERGLKHYLSYFEYNPNGVDYATAEEAERDSRDKSQLFHREDYGPVTLLFLDTTNGQDSDKTKDTNTSLTRNGSTGARAPDFNVGSLQYQWLEQNLADARATSRFVFVISHHCPYSVGKHNYANGVSNGDEIETHSDQPVRTLIPLLHRYGVTAWLCGHDEIQEHSQQIGEEILPDGTKRRHVLNVYDLGSAGDGLRGRQRIANTNEVFRAYKDASDGVHYGHLRVEAKPNAKGIWQCSLTPAYSYVTNSAETSELRVYKDQIVINEDGSFSYEQRKGVTLVEGDGTVVVGDNGEVAVDESVRKIEGTVPENVKVIYSDTETGEKVNITGAFTVSRTSGTGVSIELNPQGGVTLVEGDDPIPVTPTLTTSKDAVAPLTVGETTSVGVKTIPGLTYRLKRSESVADVSQGSVVATERAHGPSTRLTDPMKGAKPPQAFYTVEVQVE